MTTSIPHAMRHRSENGPAKVFRRIPIGIAVVCAVILWWFRYPPIDDAYITFRYASNLWSFGSFTYNLGERVVGTTSPLWAMLLTSLYGLSPDLALATQAVTLILWFALICTVSVRQTNASATFVSFLIIASSFYHPLFLSISSGMETVAYIFVVFLALSSACDCKPKVAALAAGAALGFRPDGALVALIAGCTFLLNGRGFGRFVVVYAVFVALYITGLLAFSEGVVPHSVLAKKVLYPQPLLTNFLMVLEGFQQRPWDAVLFCAGLAGFIIGRRDRLTMLYGVWSLLYIAAMSASGVKPIFFWYFVPVWFALLTFGVSGLRTVRNGGLVSVAIFVIVILGSLYENSSPVASYERESVYRAIGEKFRSDIQPGDRILAGEIGIIGFVFNAAYICDAAGIVSPQVTEALRAVRAEVLGHKGAYGDISAFEGWGGRLVKLCEPTWIIGPRGRMDLASLEGDEWFRTQYELLQVYEDEKLGGIVVFRLRRSE